MQNKIKDILTEQEKQLEIDAILQVVKENQSELTKQSIEVAKEKLVKEKEDRYISFEQQRREEHQKYTETYREEVRKEQARKLEERKTRRKLENAIIQYEKQKEDISFTRIPKKIVKKSSIIERIREFFYGKEQLEKESINMESIKHQQFQQVLKIKLDKKSNIIENYKTIENKKELER